VLCTAGDFETVAAVLEAMEEQGVRANGMTLEIITSAALSHGRDDVVGALAEHPAVSPRSAD
jgi:pentatricopeptide repeat protein